MNPDTLIMSSVESLREDCELEHYYVVLMETEFEHYYVIIMNCIGYQFVKETMNYIANV